MGFWCLEKIRLSFDKLHSIKCVQHSSFINLMRAWYNDLAEVEFEKIVVVSWRLTFLRNKLMCNKSLMLKLVLISLVSSQHITMLIMLELFYLIQSRRCIGSHH